MGPVSVPGYIPEPDDARGCCARTRACLALLKDRRHQCPRALALHPLAQRRNGASASGVYLNQDKRTAGLPHLLPTSRSRLPGREQCLSIQVPHRVEAVGAAQWPLNNALRFALGEDEQGWAPRVVTEAIAKVRDHLRSVVWDPPAISVIASRPVNDARRVEEEQTGNGEARSALPYVARNGLHGSNHNTFCNERIKRSVLGFIAQ